MAVQAYGARQGRDAREPLLSHDRHRLRQQPAASRARRTRRSAADVIARYKRLCGVETRFLMGNDEHSQNVFKKAARGGARSAGVLRPDGAGVPRDVAAARRLVRRLHPDHRAAAQGRRDGARRGASTTPATSTKACTRAGTASAARASSRKRISSTATVRCTRRSSPQWIREKNYFFRLSKYQQPLLDHFAAHPEFLQPDDPPQRDPAAARGRARRHLGQPRRAGVGHSAAVRSVERRLRLVRRADQLRVGRRPRHAIRTTVRDAGGPPTCTSSARTSRGFTP